jgi:lysozyme
MKALIDLSHWEDPNEVNYTEAKNNDVTGVFLKATQGLNYVDRTCNEHAKLANQHGLPVGLYHFVDCNADGNEQADFFLKKVEEVEKIVKLGFPLALDIEPMSGTNVGWNKVPVQTRITRVCNLIKKIEEARNEKVIIYTGPSFWSTYFAQAETIGNTLGVSFAHRQLWIAHYGVKKPTIPAPWTNYTYWQWSETAKGYGVAAGCDANWINNS